MPTPAQLRRMAAVDRRRAEALRERAALHDRQANELERLAGIAESTLTESAAAVNTTSHAMMNKDHRGAISRSKRKKGDKFGAALDKANIPSMAALSDKLGISTAALSRYVSGGRKIPRHTADRIATLTGGGWPADRAHWKNLAENEA